MPGVFAFNELQPITVLSLDKSLFDYMKFHFAILCLLIPHFSYSQQLSEDGNFAKRYSISKGIFFDSATIVSKHNISTIADHPEPDIRCFDKFGNALKAKRTGIFKDIPLSRSCGASLQNFITLANNNALEIDSAEEKLNDYLRDNQVEFLNGDSVTLSRLPFKDIYIFFTYTPYNYLRSTDGTSEKDLREIIIKQMTRDYKAYSRNTVKLYYICVTALALDGSDFKKEIKLVD